MTNVTVQVKGVQLKASTGKMHKRGASRGNRKDYIRVRIIQQILGRKNANPKVIAEMIQYIKKSKSPPYTAFMKLTKTKKYPGMMKRFYSRFKYKDHQLARIHDSSMKRNFYKDHITKVLKAIR